MLYEPEWAKRKRYAGGREIYMGALVMVMGLVLVGMGLVFIMEGAELTLMLSGIGLVVVLMGYAMVSMEVKRMPFRMYERGFTRTKVPFSQGLGRHESLVHYGMLERVMLDSTSFQGISLNHLKVTFTGPGGSSEDMTIEFQEPDNPLDVMLTFRDRAGDKLDGSLDPYVGADAVDNAVRVPFEDRAGTPTHDVLGISMSLFMMLFIAVLTGFMMTGLGMHPMSLIFAAVFQGMMYVVFMGMGTMLSTRAFKTSVGDTVKVSGGSLVLPRSYLYLLFVDTRTSLHIDEVREVRKAVDTTFYGHKALMVTALGEKVVTRHTLWEALREHPSFTLDGFVLRNRRPWTRRSRPLVAANRWRQLALALSMLLLSILLGMSSGGGGDAFFDAWDRYSPYVITGFLLVMVPLYVVLRYLIAKRASRGEGVMSSDMGLMIPGRDGSPEWIAKGEVRSAAVRKDLLGPYIELRTVEGVDKLPLTTGPKLESAGIHVEDEFGFLANVAVPAAVDMIPPPPPGSTHSVEGLGSRPRVGGRGSLLSEMPAEKVESERRKANVFGSVITVGAVLGGLLLVMAGPALFVDTICTVFVGLLVATLGALGVLLVVVGRRMSPVRVYENGVEWSSIARGPHFLGWGDFTSASETSFGGSRMLTLTRDNRAAGSISADMPRYDEWIPMVMERVADPAYSTVGEDLPESAVKYWALPMVLFAVATALGVGTAAFAGSDLGNLLTIEGWDLYLILGMTMALGYFFVLMGWMMLRSAFGLTKARFPTVALVLPVAVMLLVYFAVLGVAGPMTIAYSVDIIESEDPGTTVLEPGEYADVDITADGPVTVGAGETLTLHNVSLTFDPAPGLDYGIWVHPEGTLIMDDALVTSVDDDVGFCFEIHGKATIIGSTIGATASDPDAVNGEGGLELYSTDVRVEDTLFSNALSAAMMTVYCSPTIRNCTFTGTLDEGIEMHGGAPRVEGCTFVDCEWPIIVWNGSEAEIFDCTIRDCPRGIDLAQSSVTIRGCTFRNITEYAVQWTSDTRPQPQLEENTFENVGTEIDIQTSFAGLGSICTAVTVLTSVIGTAALMAMNRKRPERVRPQRDPEILA